MLALTTETLQGRHILVYGVTEEERDSHQADKVKAIRQLSPPADAQKGTGNDDLSWKIHPQPFDCRIATVQAPEKQETWPWGTSKASSL